MKTLTIFLILIAGSVSAQVTKGTGDYLWIWNDDSTDQTTSGFFTITGIVNDTTLDIS